MPSEIAKAYVQIIPTTQGISNNLFNELSEPAEAAGKKSGGIFGNSVAGSAAKVIGIGAAAIGTAVAGASTALISAASDVSKYGDEIDKVSQKLGVSAEFYQEWDAVLQHSGASMSGVSSSFKTLANAAQGATKDQAAAFQELGLSMDAIASMSTEDLFSAVVSGLQNMEEGTKRTAIATDLLGRGALELGPLFNTSAEDTQAMIDAVHSLGGVMSGDAVKASAQYRDSLQDMQTAFAGLRNNMIAEFLPSLSLIVDGISGMVTGSEEGIANFTSGFDTLIDNITNAASDILPGMVDTITSIVASIVDALPSIVPPLVDAIVDIIINSIPTLISAGIQLLTAIIGALPEIITTITNALPQIISGITSTLANNIPQLVTAGVDLFVALIQNLPQIITTIVKSIPQIITSIIGGLRKGIPDIASVGKALIEGLWNGMQSMSQWVQEKVSGFVSGIVGGIKSLLGIHSPSRVFAGIGGYMAEGLGNGFAAEMADVKREIFSDVNDVVSTVGTASASLNASVSSGVPDQSKATADNNDRLIAAIRDLSIQVHVLLDSREIKSGQDRLARMVG